MGPFNTRTFKDISVQILYINLWLVVCCTFKFIRELLTYSHKLVLPTALHYLLCAHIVTLQWHMFPQVGTIAPLNSRSNSLDCYMVLNLVWGSFRYSNKCSCNIQYSLVTQQISKNSCIHADGYTVLTFVLLLYLSIEICYDIMIAVARRHSILQLSKHNLSFSSHH